MSALTEKQRAFVVAYNNAGITGYGGGVGAVKAAGYAQDGNQEYVQAHRLLHDPSIQEAIREDIKSRFVADLGATLAGIDEIASNPQHPQRLKALTTKLHHAGLIEKTLTETQTTVTLSFEQRLDQLKQLASIAGKPVTDFLPAGVTVSDAEFEEVLPPSTAGLEDLL